MKWSLYTVTFLALLPACDSRQEQPKVNTSGNEKVRAPFIKPPTISSDTLTIDSKAAIFYYPDSLQLQKMRAGSDTAKFDAAMHEYFYLFKYLHTGLKESSRHIRIIDARNVRYLLFKKKDGRSELIDLDTKLDPYGLFIFDPQKSPIQPELSNALSEVGFYFSP
jgi:hypothetical protein